MTLMRRPTLAATAVLAALLTGCAHGPAATPSVPAPPPVAAPPPAPEPVIPAAPKAEPVDPVAERLKAVDKEFASGQSELALGHLVGAREAFDRAVDLLLAAPGGARTEPRFESAYQRLLDQITALEATALREGDGFTEVRSEPAALDALLNGPESARPQPLATTAERVAADLERTPHDLTIPMNNKVLSYIELFQGSLHDFMANSLARGARYLPMIREVFRAEGLPLDLIYVPVVESAFQPTALSRASAKGLWQFVLGTGRENGLDQTWFVDERSDPEKATHAAAQYLKSLNSFFGGDWNLALASYNVGPGALERAMKRSKLTDYWNLTATSKYLPRETREYVPMILAAIVIAANPTEYGFEAPTLTPMTSERVTVPDALDLRLIAEWTGVSVDEIRDLNPELRRATTPVGKHELKVPIGTAAAVEARLAAADPGVFVKFNTYTVKSGDTLAAIARRFKVKTADLAQSNQLRTTSQLREGQTLMIPRDPVATAALTTQPHPTPPPTAGSASAPAGGQTVMTYRVKSGDTLTSIARQFDTTVQTLKQLNQLSTDVIVVGAKLTVRR
jgi:membrane-bound lytic murein transglycosylase D